MADRKIARAGEVLPVMAAAATLGLMLWWIARWLIAG
jgi:hypothetical protein